MPSRMLARLGGSPRNEPALVELDRVILAPRTITGEPHHEHLTDIADSPPGGSLGQVAVTVPPRLKGRVGDELKDPLGASCDLPASPCNARNVMVIGHTHHP